MIDFSHANKWFGIIESEMTGADLHAKWDAEHINRNADTVRKALFGCKYIIEVKWRKIYSSIPKGRVLNWEPDTEFEKQYMYPARELGDHCVLLEMRGVDSDRDIFERNEFGTDGVFIGTDNEADALMIALKYK